MERIPPTPPAPRPGARYYTRKQLAARYGVSPQTIWRWARRGLLPKGERLGYRTVRWRDDVVEQFEYLRRVAIT